MYIPAMMSIIRYASFVVIAAAAFLTPRLAAAQSPTMMPSHTGLGTPTGPVVGNGANTAERPKEQAPPAIPGSHVDQPEAAPAQSPTADMQPNEALFDAINRGDITAARDAISRGADLNARNVLGMTPTDLSIDIGRNDITFLLLSMRSLFAQDQSKTTKVAARPGARGATAARVASEFGSPFTSTMKSPRSGAITPASAQQVAPRQFAGDGGAPVPQAGFLGFGSATC